MYLEKCNDGKRFEQYLIPIISVLAHLFRKNYCATTDVSVGIGTGGGSGVGVSKRLKLKFLM